jgi:arylsulfatase A-like enzyme
VGVFETHTDYFELSREYRQAENTLVVLTTDHGGRENHPEVAGSFSTLAPVTNVRREDGYATNKHESR